MNNFKSYSLSALVLYIFFYLLPVLANPFSYINLMQMIITLLYIFGGFFIAHILFYTNKTNLDTRVKNTIMAVIIVVGAFFIFYSPLSYPTYFNVHLGNFITIIGLLLCLAIIVFWLKTIGSSYFILIIFLPTIVQGILSRLSSNALLFYVKNPNFTTYLIIISLIVYYFIGYVRNKK